MKSTVCRLKVPSFDLTTLTIATGSSSGKSGPSQKEFVLVPGGGGSTKSGVKNQIVGVV
jgi:hypothetical protein